MAVDYSAMSEIVRKAKGYPLKVQTKFLELETGAYRVYPDNTYTAEQLFKFLSLPQPIRSKKGFVARKAAEQYYNWDTVAKIWENYFDAVELEGLQGKWDEPQTALSPPDHIPEFTKSFSNEDFVKWLMLEVWREPERLNGHYALSMLRALNYGFEQHGRDIRPLGRQDVFAYVQARVNNKVHAEDARSGRLRLESHDFIEVAQ